jgi:hypothetical protein
MKIRITFATATALGLLMGGAYATDNNHSYIDQVGSGNSALITQGGSNNRAGSNSGVTTASLPDNPNPLGVADGRILQYGNNQSLTINQAGDGNQAGASTANPWLGINQGHTAASTNNVLTIEQLSSSNIVGRVRQTGNGNTASVTQEGGNTNFISNLYQEHGNTATVVQDGEQNWIGQFGSRDQANGGAVYQAVHYGASGRPSTLQFTQEGDYNVTARVTQRGGFETATIDVVGNNNTLKMMDQSTGLGGDVIGHNVASVLLTGNYNGSGAGVLNPSFPGYSSYGVFTPGSAAAGVLTSVADYIAAEGAIAGASSFVVPAIPNATSGFQSSLHQFGSDNDLAFHVLGDSNQFGMLQGGDRNFINGIVGGSFNEAGIVLHGDDNRISFTQDDNGNSMGVSAKGNNNHLNIRQDAGASGNSLAVNIVGNNNNAPGGLSPNLSGAAGAVRDAVQAAPLGDALFARGDLIQEGSGNVLRGATIGSAMTVTGSGNAFATFQAGDNNTIAGAITGGSNQAVVAQIGNGNMAAMTQNGNSNVLGVSQ